MPYTRLVFATLLAASACAGGGSNAGSRGGAPDTYAAANGDKVTMEFGSGGVFSMAAEGIGSSKGTYTVDGEKLIVNVDGRTVTFFRNGDCIEDQQNMYGKLCKGGAKGAAANVSTRPAPVTTGTWIATNADGEFKMVFNPSGTLSLTATPSGGSPDTQQGTYTVEGDQIHATVGQSVPLVLRWVNGTYESTSFGLPMKFVRQ